MVDISDYAKNIRRIGLILGYAFQSDDYYKTTSMQMKKLLNEYKKKFAIDSSELPSNGKLDQFCKASERLCITYKIKVVDDDGETKVVKTNTGLDTNKTNTDLDTAKTNDSLSTKPSAPPSVKPYNFNSVFGGSLVKSELRYPTGLDAVIALPLFLLDMLLHLCKQKYKPVELNGIVTEILKHEKRLFVYHEKMDLLVYASLND
jgi:hypothetical protein